MEKDALLHVKDLRTYFYTDLGVAKAVNGVDFRLKHGEIMGLVGESGCGKSVTAHTITGLLKKPPARVKSGEILFEGRNLLALEQQALRKIRGHQISMIYQEPMTSLNPLFRIGKQLAEPIMEHLGRSKTEARDMSVALLRDVGIPDPEKRIRDYPHHMSGGMRQRVMIAIALACRPRMIIADEPTTALDVTIQAQILDLMLNLTQEYGTAILLITHDLAVVAETADFVAVMYAGCIVEHADVKSIFTSPRHPYTLGLFGSIPSLNAPVPEDRLLSAIPGVVPNLLSLPGGCVFRKRCSKSIHKCKTQAPPFFEFDRGHKVRCWLYE